MNLVHKITLTTIAIFSSLAIATTAMAVGPLSSHANAHALTAGAASGVSRASTHQPSDPGSQASTHLAAAQLRACQNRERAINNIMARIADRGQKQLNLFGTIATRVENFYTTKGNTLNNYDSLVADVNAKAATAQTVVNTVKSDSVTFKCDGTDPKGAAQSFLADLKSEISALQAYRTSVKNLIVGVKSVDAQTSSAGTSTSGGTQQ